MTSEAWYTYQCMNRHLEILLFTFLLLLGASACQSTSPTPPELNVYAATALIEPFRQMEAAFGAQNPQVEITFNFAGSQQLAQQIAQGAPVDVFASANKSELDALLDLGLAQPNNLQAFASNRLVIVLPADNPAGLVSLADLDRPGLKLVLAAPEVPAGRYSQEFLARASHDAQFDPAYGDRVRQNVVSYEENVKAVLSKVILGEGDAGIVYVSDLASTRPGQVSTLEIPPSLNSEALFWIAPMVESPHPDLAAAWIEFVLSPDGQAILQENGFLPVP